MRRFFAILFVIFILLAGMHLTVATHFCSGEIAATRVSFAGKAASCGMESDYDNNQTNQTSISSHCCDNEIALYSVDKNYTPSDFQVRQSRQSVPLEYNIPETITSQFNNITSLLHPNASPPCHFSANAVSMADICVFRI